MRYRGLILFDIDGVIRDVSNSYRKAVQKTVKHFCKWEPNVYEIDNLKNEGIWNNDWDLSLELIKRYIRKNSLKTNVPSRNKIIENFEKLYFGCNPKEDYSNWTGFIKNEKLLIDKILFQEFDMHGIGWGFVSGAEKPSAKFVLEKKLDLIKPPLIAMGDAPDKPNPSGILFLANKLFKSKLGSNCPPIVYVGDTVADIKTIINARKKIPSQKFISIGIAPPHLHKESFIKARKEYELGLKKKGADMILKSVNDLREIYDSFF